MFINEMRIWYAFVINALSMFNMPMWLMWSIMEYCVCIWFVRNVVGMIVMSYVRCVNCWILRLVIELWYHIVWWEYLCVCIVMLIHTCTQWYYNPVSHPSAVWIMLYEALQIRLLEVFLWSVCLHSFVGQLWYVTLGSRGDRFVLMNIFFCVYTWHDFVLYRQTYLYMSFQLCDFPL